VTLKKNPIPLLMLLLVCLAAYFVPVGVAQNMGGAINSGDTAWIVAAEVLQPTDTPERTFHICSLALACFGLVDSVSRQAPQHGLFHFFD